MALDGMLAELHHKVQSAASWINILSSMDYYSGTMVSNLGHVTYFFKRLLSTCSRFR